MHQRLLLPTMEWTAPRAGPPGCTFCGAADHAHTWTTRCPRFHAVKHGITPTSYVSTSLLPGDAAGYAAAGLLPWRVLAGRVEVLLAREHRHGALRLNVIGGMRDALGEDALAAARRELVEETLGLLRADEPPRWCAWTGTRRYAIYVPPRPVPPAHAADFLRLWRASAARPSDAGLSDFAWVPLADLRSPAFLAANLHPYVVPWIWLLSRAGILAWLQQQASPSWRVAAAARSAAIAAASREKHAGRRTSAAGSTNLGRRHPRAILARPK